MGKVLRQVKYVQCFGYPCVSDLWDKWHNIHGGEIGFTDNTFIWAGVEYLRRNDPQIGHGLMVNKPLRREAG